MGDAYKEWEEPAKFNMALATLQRMHELLVGSRDIMIKDDPDYKRVFKIEEELWMELRPYLQKKEDLKKPVDKLIKELKMKTDYNHNFRKRKLINKEGKQSFVIGLKELRIMIRDLMDKKGYLMPKSDDPRYAAFQ
jgi:hypothetical protein